MQQLALFWVSFAETRFHVGSSCTSPFPCLCPIPGSHPCRSPTVPALLGPLQNASSGDFQISPGSCISEVSLPAQCPVGSTWVISELSDRSITPLGFLLSLLEADSVLGGYLGLVLY